MSPAALSLLALAASFAHVSAQAVTGTFPPVPLASKHYAYPDQIPYMVDTDQGLIRGYQYGYNKCNSTTENQNSNCQTSFVNAIDDFCLWAPPKANSVVADTEGEMVAWCTKPGRGTRLIPADALKGVQYIRTPDYAQVVGFIDQTKINLQDGDYGGEMDPHGADLRGNPMGGLMYSTAFNGQYEQVIEWHNFMGGNAFCIKVCDPNGPAKNAAGLCEHRLDRIGCAYNVPNNAQTGVFESCKGDNQDPPGVYTENGVVMTYSQPPEDLGAITTMPYQPKVPSSSECQTFTSAALYTALASVSAPGASSTASGSGSSAPAATGSASGTSKPGSSSTKSGSTPSNTSNDATTMVVGGFATALGVVFSALFLS
jgi:hypothetical protein